MFDNVQKYYTPKEIDELKHSRMWKPNDHKAYEIYINFKLQYYCIDY